MPWHSAQCLRVAVMAAIIGASSVATQSVSQSQTAVELTKMIPLPNIMLARITPLKPDEIEFDGTFWRKATPKTKIEYLLDNVFSKNTHCWERKSDQKSRLPLVLTGAGFNGSDDEICNVIAQVIATTRQQPAGFNFFNTHFPPISHQPIIIIRDWKFKDIKRSMKVLADASILIERLFNDGGWSDETRRSQEIHAESSEVHNADVTEGRIAEGSCHMNTDTCTAHLQLKYFVEFYGVAPNPPPSRHQVVPVPLHPPTPKIEFVYIHQPSLPTATQGIIPPPATILVPGPPVTPTVSILTPIRMVMMNTDPLCTMSDWFNDCSPYFAVAGGITIFALLFTFYAHRVRSNRDRKQLEDLFDSAQPFPGGV